MTEIERTTKPVTIEQLELKRDILEFVLRMRLFSNIQELKSKSTPILSPTEYKRYICNFHNWDKELLDLLDRAKSLNFNPNELGEGFIGSSSAGVSIPVDFVTYAIDLNSQIAQALRLCPNAKSLCAELISFYRENKIRPLSKETLSKAIETLLSKYIPYDPSSLEYNYIMETDENSHNFIAEFFETYFIKKDTAPEDKKRDFDALFVQANDELNHLALKRLLKYLPFYLDNGIILSDRELICMIESKNYSSIMPVLAKYPASLPFTPVEYIDSLFDEATGGKMMPHDNDSGFYTPHNLAIYKDADDFGHQLVDVTLSLTKIRSEAVTNECTIVHLAQKIAGVPNGQTIMYILNYYLERAAIIEETTATCKAPKNIRKLQELFESEYQKEKERIESQGKGALTISEANPNGA